MGHTDVYFNGRRARSVSEVCGLLDSPGLRLYYGRLGIKKAVAYKNSSADTGTSVHDAIKLYLQKSEFPTDLPDKVAHCFTQFVEWHSDQDFKPLLIDPDEPLKDEENRLSGTPDCVALYNGQLAVFDWKTSREIDLSYGFQLAGYAHLYNRQYGEMPKFGYIFKMDKKGQNTDCKRFVIEPNLKVFYSLLKLYDELEATGWIDQWKAQKREIEEAGI